jgi:hypothetical protein
MEIGDVLALYKALFVVRADTFALQRADGSYFRVPRPITDLLVQAHMGGHITAGWYALHGGMCRWLCFDADDRPGWAGLHRLQAVFAADGIVAHREHSRRGGHLWVLLDGLLLADAARRVGLSYLDRLGLTGSVELYPRQDRAPYGSLVRGPFGVHRLDGRRYLFDLAGSVAEQLTALWSARASSERLLALDRLREVQDVRVAPPPPRRRPVRGGSAIARLNRLLDVWALASGATRLDPQTGMGRCPFHPPDRHPSFGVNRREGWWICFHGADGSGRRPMGGDAFEFYCRLNGLSHREGVARLGYLLR